MRSLGNAKPHRSRHTSNGVQSGPAKSTSRFYSAKRFNVFEKSKAQQESSFRSLSKKNYKIWAEKQSCKSGPGNWTRASLSCAALTSPVKAPSPVLLPPRKTALCTPCESGPRIQGTLRVYPIWKIMFFLLLLQNTQSTDLSVSSNSVRRRKCPTSPWAALLWGGVALASHKLWAALLADLGSVHHRACKNIDLPLVERNLWGWMFWISTSTRRISNKK